ncbi:MAG TPA: AMP-binding protein [Amycolatopsis sp.]|nr:AMP-binding protein [Amycolatopsis sp.]
MTLHPALLRPDDIAARLPEQPAMIMAVSGDVLTYGQLTRHSIQLARLWRERGLRVGDHIAVLMNNRPEYLEAIWAARRSGLYYTPINWHLTADEVRYIVENCDARALVVSENLLDVAEAALTGNDRVVVKLAVGGERSGWDRYENTVYRTSDAPLEQEIEGQQLLYSSGTTGRPKGILHSEIDPDRAFGDVGADMLWQNTYGWDETCVDLEPGPLYHAAPLVAAMRMHRFGGSVVVMERFDAETVLRAIEQYRVTSAQFVPTMFVRMLRLPEQKRAAYDLCSLRMVVHAAAPCPVDVKHRMIEWLGPIVHEYYSATEAAGRVAIGPEEWLRHPGSVGRPEPGALVITAEDGTPLPAGEDGVIWFTKPEKRFSYHGDAGKSASMYNERGWATMGDLGHLDAEGYLFLTGRSGDTIISGGVNIYPREVEDVLIGHDLVDDVAVIGIPDEEYGQSVRAVIKLRHGAGSPELAAEIIAWCRDRLAHYKCPKSIRFTAELPRTPTGKMMKHRLEENLAGTPRI